ncbi:hypothetical protein JTE90_013436 [Oedothorax gibbosus]|uniref:Uncharacterized protein n=1 Tax=Oedothorax gibbosus TaxID=931172 RepID=A0AAV6TSH1_9ARAC|nr:hypothetical protein JTE90_013436 [Oedothorax gibbosus]
MEFNGLFSAPLEYSQLIWHTFIHSSGHSSRNPPSSEVDTEDLWDLGDLQASRTSQTTERLETSTQEIEVADMTTDAMWKLVQHPSNNLRREVFLNSPNNVQPEEPIGNISHYFSTHPTNIYAPTASTSENTCRARRKLCSCCKYLQFNISLKSTTSSNHSCPDLRFPD